MNIPELRFPEFEGEWEKKKLGEVTDSISSGKSNNKLAFGEFPFYGSTGLIGYTNNYGYTGKIILIARVGANAGSLYKVDGKYSVSDNTLMLKINDKGILDFVQYYLNKYDLNKLVFGSGQPLITGGHLKELSLYFPDLPEQSKIATFLTAVDEKLQALKKKKSLLEVYKKGVMQKLFSQELRFQSEDGKGFGDWKEKKLGEVFEILQRPIKKPIGNYLAIGIRSHFKGTFQKPESDPTKIEMETLYVVKENDLIVNITFAWEGAVAIANKKDSEGLVSHRFPTYKNNEDLLYINFFRYLYINDKFKNELELISPGGAGRNRVLKKADFLKIQFNFPEKKEQIKIANFLSSLDEKINHTQTEISKTEVWKKGLLQKMFV